MLDQALKNKIAKIKIQTRRIMNNTLSGDYLSAFKGSGLEFEQIRDYQIGDDIRSIDWNSSAKMNKMMVKQFVEERDRTVILAIDTSASTLFSSEQELCKDTIAQLAATLAFVASDNKDKVGVLFFSDTIEKWIAPSKGNVHLGAIIESIFTMQPKYKGTNIAHALRFLVNLKKKNAVVFVISDWVDQIADYSHLLHITNCRYDLVGVRITDKTLSALPDIGLVEIVDPEQKVNGIIATNRQDINIFLQARLIEQKKIFEKYNIDLLDLIVGQSFIKPLINFFHRRIRRQI